MKPERPPNPIKTDKRGWPIGLALLVAAQIVCVCYFLLDVFIDISHGGSTFEHLLELAVVVVMTAAILYELPLLMNMIRRQAHLEESLVIANSAVHDIIEYHFNQWKLTPAEHDVATFLVKGFSTAEIAKLRNSAEGTVKAQLNSIYKKSGTSNRAELLSLIIDSIMGGKEQAERAA